MQAAAEHSRRTAPSRAAFWLVAGVFCLLFCAARAPTPLYGVYRAQLRFSATALTAVFAVYAQVLLLTLLVFGSVSDYLGRRRVILAALVVSADAARAVRCRPKCAVATPAITTGMLSPRKDLHLAGAYHRHPQDRVGHVRLSVPPGWIPGGFSLFLGSGCPSGRSRGVRRRPWPAPTAGGA